VPGRRTEEHTRLLVEDFHARTGGRLMRLMTSDAYPAYATAILEVYGEEVTPPRRGRRGRRPAPRKVAPANLQYATVHKIRENNRVVRVETCVVFGTWLGVLLALALSAVSKVVNTAFIERHNGSDRNGNARKTRKSYCFSKDWGLHEAVTYFTMYSANFCRPVRTLQERKAEGGWRQRTPAMAAGLADHVWSLAEWLSFPAIQRR
jgi:IS1 family transposase